MGRSVSLRFFKKKGVYYEQRNQTYCKRNCADGHRHAECIYKQRWKHRSGGGGARIYKDGVDTGGLEGAPRVSIANVEEYEQQYPILYLNRREYPDSGGVGKYRGGNGLDRMYTVHDADRIDDVIMHSIGSQVPATAGLAGGHPSATNLFMIKRTGSENNVFSHGIPANFEGIEAQPEYFGAMAETSLSI